MRRTSFFFLLVASVFLHVQGKTTEYAQSELFPVSDDSISIEDKARFKEEKVVTFQPTNPHDHHRKRCPLENITDFDQRPPTCSAERHSVRTKQEAHSYRDAKRSRQERTRRNTEQQSARNTQAESYQRQRLNDRRRLSIDSRGRRDDIQGYTSSVNRRLQERKDTQNSERRADLRTTASSAESQRWRSSINYRPEHGQRDSDIRNRRDSSERRNRRASSERLMRFTSERRNTRDSSERRNTRDLSERRSTRVTSERLNTRDLNEQRSTRGTSERRNTGDTSERRNIGDTSERRNMRDTRERRNMRDTPERRNMRVSTERHNTRDLNERRNTRDTSERNNTRYLNERRGTRGTSERRNMRDTSERRSMRVSIERHNTRDLNERHKTRDLNERRNAKNLNERRNTRDTSERRKMGASSERRNTRDTTKRRIKEDSSVEITDTRYSKARALQLDYTKTDAVRRMSQEPRRMMRRSGESENISRIRDESEIISRTLDERIRIGESRILQRSDNFRIIRSRNNIETRRQVELRRVEVRENNKYEGVGDNGYTNDETEPFEKQQRAIFVHVRQGKNRQRQSQRRDGARRGNTVGTPMKAERTLYDEYIGLGQRLEKRWSRRKDLKRDYEVHSFVYLQSKLKIQLVTDLISA